MAKRDFQKLANAIRFLSADAVQRANSGHPGMPMGFADVATILFANHLKFNPKDATWPDRDRFVLSAGHGSMLLYSILYLTQYSDVEIDDLKNFRQLGSKAAGHPEYGEFAGIETTTGPLGQGIATAVGMALAERMQNAKFGDKLVNHYTYCVVGDGCLMEGISQEAISLAGHLKLNKLIVLFDDNEITIDGSTKLTTSDDVALRFQASQWHTIAVDGHNYDQIDKALIEAKKSDKPTLIACKTKIGFGSPNLQGSQKTHGAPLGEDEIKAARKKLGYTNAHFVFDEDTLKEFKSFGKRSFDEHRAWQDRFEKSDQKEEFHRLQKRKIPETFDKKLQKFKQQVFMEKPKQATRKSSGNVLEILTKEIPELIGGSADLTGSVCTKTSSTKDISANNFKGRYINYGVREHAMAAIMNGISLHKGFIPYAGTFLVFSDYMKPAIRLAAMMKQQILYIFTHDSIGLGEDGPTHQPVEHLASLRSIPNLNVFRPADAQETIGCYQQALLSKKNPSAIVLTRQNVDFLRANYTAGENLCQYGAYIISDTALGIEPDVIILATGSEVTVAVETKKKLHKDGFAVRVVSMPCFELFNKQAPAYKNKILGEGDILKVGIEAGVYQGWHRVLSDDGIFIGMEGFGASGKAEDLFKHFGINSDNAHNLIKEEVLKRRRRRFEKINHELMDGVKIEEDDQNEDYENDDDF